MEQWVRCQVVMGKGMCNGILSCSWMFPNRLASYSVALSSRVIFLLWFEDGGKKKDCRKQIFHLSVVHWLTHV